MTRAPPSCPHTAVHPGLALSQNVLIGRFGGRIPLQTSRSERVGILFTVASQCTSRHLIQSMHMTSIC